MTKTFLIPLTAERAAVVDALTIGAVFSTDFETGCIVTVAPAYDGRRELHFLALDSEGVECEYPVGMVTEVRA